jgi:hypothetical protein
MTLSGGYLKERGSLGDMQTDIEANNDQEAAGDERDAPSPAQEVRVIEEGGEKEEDAP